MKIWILSLLLFLFYTPDGILIYLRHPVSGLWIYHGPIQEIELKYYEFPEDLQYVLIPYKEGKNVLVIRKNGRMRSVCYGEDPGPEMVDLAID